MDIFDYQLKWDRKALNRFKTEDFKDLAVDDSTIQFLTTIGLPDSAAPFVSFDKKELKTIKRVYSTNNSTDSFLLDIGSDGAGDPICIDMRNNCRVVALDHEDNFAARFANASARELFAFLTIYKEFVNNIRRLKGDDAYINANFSDKELSGLLEELRLVDNEALSSDETFWSKEIETLRANKVE